MLFGSLCYSLRHSTSAIRETVKLELTDELVIHSGYTQRTIQRHLPVTERSNKMVPVSVGTSLFGSLTPGLRVALIKLTLSRGCALSG